MKRMSPSWALIVLLLLAAAPRKGMAQDIPYSSGDGAWNPDSLGNHRARVRFEGEGSVARLVIPWRRRDDHPEDKCIIIQDARTGQKVRNTKTGVITNERGEIWFEPLSGKGDYYIYYMPYKNEGRSNYPRGVYLKPDTLASADWLKKADGQVPVNTFTQDIQSVDEINSFFPMEVIATGEESARLIGSDPAASFLVFPEDRMHPIRMKDHLPLRWVRKGAQHSFTDTAARGEWLAFQFGVLAIKEVKELGVQFTALRSAGGNIIPAANITCLNTEGTGYDGKPVHFQVNIPSGKVQALWCGVDLPKGIAAGVYTGTATLLATDGPPSVIQLSIVVTGRQAVEHGIGEPWKQQRLKWLNSTLAQRNEVIAPYTPLKVHGHSISLLGRQVLLSDDGFPAQIQTFFTPEMTGYAREPNALLVAPMRLIVQGTPSGQGSSAAPESLILHRQGLTFTRLEPGTVRWRARSSSRDLSMEVSASMEFDGFIAYRVKLVALRDLSLEEIALDIPFRKEMAKYMMGLGLKGGYRPGQLDWKWDTAHKNQDGAWIGTVNAGLQYSLRDERYIRPLNTNFYLQKPLLLPSSWGNENKGGISLGQKDGTVLVHNYSGERRMKKGESLYYNFNLLITPFHPINTDFQWATRFFHSYKPVDTVRTAGATVVNIHHATAINPYINYPFIEHRKLKAYIDEAHSKGIKVKIYNTVRELSDRAYELFPMRSLGHEIYSTGKGGGFSWLQEHVGEDYIAAWFVPEIKDAALVNSGMSRWHNYYVEGMNWLVQNTGIDGIYLDDVAFDRITMKRIKRVLIRGGHPGIIDLHSANQYNKNDGFNNSANLYMEHFPYLNRLWFGEYFDYEKNGPDFFLTEVSGIPFGLMGEMLQGGGNPWRGMVYGMTNRMPWSDNADPRPIWQLWDEFGMQGSKMVGYWSDNSPVTTGNDKILATVYERKGAALISLASWADTSTQVELRIDWKKLGLDPAKVRALAPELAGIQTPAVFEVTPRGIAGLKVEKGKGWMILLKDH
jgi:hypothetical protein